ncbi:hypothetical protein LTR95_004387 [Oleoguttula sp. CCFEE 5521]
MAQKNDMAMYCLGNPPPGTLAQPHLLAPISTATSALPTHFDPLRNGFNVNCANASDANALDNEDISSESDCPSDCSCELHDDSDWEGDCCKGLYGLYDRCTTEELQRFAHDRGVPATAPTSSTRSHYIQQLMDADESPAFRLMDLPPEMRALIFTEMLMLRPSKYRERHRACDAQVLRTSRQVYVEAGDLLSSCNTIVCHAHAWAQVLTKTHNKIEDNYALGGWLNIELPVLPSTVPSSILQVHRVAITVEFNPVPDLTHAEAAVKNYVLELCTVLMESDSLEELNVHVVDHAKRGQVVAAATLWPLRRLRRPQRSSLTGDVTEALREEISAEVQGDTPTYNTLLQCGRLLTAAQCYFDLVGAIEKPELEFRYGYQRRFYGHPECFDCGSLYANIKEVGQRIESWFGDDFDSLPDVDLLLDSPFASEASEVVLRNDLNVLQQLLSIVNPKKIVDSLTALQGATEAVTLPYQTPRRFAIEDSSAAQMRDPVVDAHTTVFDSVGRA